MDRKIGRAMRRWVKASARAGALGGATLAGTLVAVLACTPGKTPASEPREPPVDASWLRTELERIRAQTGVPGLAAAVVDRGGVIAIAAAGRRRVDEEVPLAVSDKFHLGSDTKAMTAFVVARMVERGRLRWDLTLAEAFPEWRASMNEAYRPVQLKDVLRHRAGMPSLTSAADEALLEGIDEENQPLVAQRLALARNVLHRPPAVRPGEKWLYSNAGYVVVGALLERVAGKPWEEVMREELFVPLRMDSCGFGPPAVGAARGQPFGHRVVEGAYRPTDEDNSALIGPAGTVHCALPDWASFARANMEPSPVPRLKPETLALLHEPVPMETPQGDAVGYAMGWGSAPAIWAQGQMLLHDGSNGHHRARIRLGPKRGLGFLIVTNAGDDRALQTVRRTFEKLVDRMGGQRR